MTYGRNLSLGVPIFLLIFALASSGMCGPPTSDNSDKSITNSLGMKFALIPAGSFTMGSPQDSPQRGNDETQHKVTLSKSFYLQTTEVTQGQWKRVMGHNPAHIRDCGENCPVESVSWKEAQEFIEKLNKMEGTHKYRLPTEAEWEYACRAGTTTPFSTGKCISTDQANYNATNPMPGCPKGEARGKIVSVGSFPPNPWGLYDMHGNVWEWCQDWYGDYPQGEVTDPRGPASGRYRVFRGGSYDFDAWLIRSAVRGYGDPESHSGSVGFRLVRDF